MSSTAAAELDLYRTTFESLETNRPLGEPAWLRTLRRDGLKRFEERGFPTTRDEDWKYTSVTALARTPFRRPIERDIRSVTADTVSGLLFRHAFDGHQIVFVNGRYLPELSSVAGTDGVEIASLKQVLVERPQVLEPHLARHTREHASAFVDLNTAFLEDGAFVSVPASTVLKEPIHIVHFSTRGRSVEPTVSHPRTLILAGRQSEVRILESFGGLGSEDYLTNAVTEIVLEDGAIVDHHKVQGESPSAFHVATLAVTQGRASRFTSHNLSLGALLARTDIHQVFAAEGGECVLNGLFMGAGRQHTDTHTHVDHAQPHCTTRELYKGILDGQSRGVFVGTIVVRPDAQKTDAHQTNKNLLLSTEALVDSVPQLEIHADDVKCKHGSTTGQLDAAALFYLRSRGIGEDAARALLTYAFASDVVGRISVEPLRQGLIQYLQARLPSALHIEEAVS
jgi:Fe-S cluster assembly protein SufD